MSRRYDLHAQGLDGVRGPVVAWARESLAVLSVQVMFYGDKARTQPIFGFVGKTGEVGYKVTDHDGQLIGEFRKVLKSALRSSWELSTPDGMTAMGQERSTGLAFMRRVLDLFGKSWLRYDFDFATGDGEILLTSDSESWIRGRYQITIPLLSGGRQLDWRVGAAMAVALDTLESR